MIVAVRYLPTKIVNGLLSFRVLGGGLGLIYAVMIVLALSGQRAPDEMLANRLGKGVGMADRLIMLEGDQIVMSGGSEKDYPRTASWTSAEISLQMPSTEIIPSWNGSVPANCGVRLELRTRARRGDWSPWLYFGSWGRCPAGEKIISFEDGEVYIDNLILVRAADLLQVRVQCFSYEMNDLARAVVRRISVSYSGYAPRLAEADRAGLKVEQSQWCRDLKVPFRTQKDAPPALANQICSPTSVSMVMEYFGVNRPTVENALAIYDAEYDLFGNWARAVQRAGELGLDGWLQRFRNWEQVKVEIAKGSPVIASIAFKKGEFPSAVISRTNGHLIVIRGFNASGDVIVNDPANREKGEGAVYKAEELGNAWFGHGGVGYVITKHAHAYVGMAPTSMPAQRGK